MIKTNEKKNIIKSVKMTEEQKNLIEENAKLSGMSFSGYILHSALKSDKKITPQILVKIQKIVNMACNLSEDNIETLESEVNKLWEYLK